MLVLSRRIGEAVKCTGGITVRVLRVNGCNVRLGFEAPESIRIIREELARGVPLHDIEDAFDDEENQERRADRASSRPSITPNRSKANG